jgi:hypothetical protein
MSLEFAQQYDKGKTIHEDLIAKVLKPNDPRPKIIYDTPLEGFGHGISKVQKAIQDERQDLLFRDQEWRASILPMPDPRRIAFFANSQDSFSNKVIGSLPHGQVPFTATEWTTTVAMHFGVPVPCLKPYIDEPIRNNSNCPQLTVDPCGFHLSTVTGIKGGATQRNHNNFSSLVSQGLITAGIKHLGGATHDSCKAIFSTAIPNNIHNDATSTNHLNSIIVDISMYSKPLYSDGPLAGADHFIDFKTLGAGDSYVTDCKVFNGTVNTRQFKVNENYHRTASALDFRLHASHS